MGHYTSLVISARLKPDTPSDIIRTIASLLAGKEPIYKVLLGVGALQNPLNGTSAMFPEASSNLQLTKDPDSHTLNVISHIKNYHQEIEGIIEWLKPHIESGHGLSEWWAIVTYEEDERPTIHYLREPSP